MAPASGSVNDPKMHPAATMDDQEMVEAGTPNPIVLGPAPFSSPDPATDGIKMLPLEDGTSAYDAAKEAEKLRDSAKVVSGENYDDLKKDELVSLAEERGLDVEGKKKDEILAALREDDASDYKAADFKSAVEAAQDQDALDEAAEFYANSGKEFSSVDKAIEKRQQELNDAANS